MSSYAVAQRRQVRAKPRHQQLLGLKVLRNIGARIPRKPQIFFHARFFMPRPRKNVFGRWLVRGDHSPTRYSKIGPRRYL